MNAIQWRGCYDGHWRDLIVAEAFTHPAKFAPELVRKIVNYGIARGYWKEGDTIGDPFGGIAGGGIICAYHRLKWIGVEIEPKFVELARKNIALHADRWKRLGAAQPVIVQGDSRQFDQIVAGVITSPPYAETMNHSRSGIDWQKSPDIQRRGAPKSRIDYVTERHDEQNYGKEDGQIGALKEGAGVEGVICSPPFSTEGGGGAKGINIQGYRGKKSYPSDDKLGARTYQGSNGDRCGQNIEKCATGNIEAVIASPPYSSIAAGAGGLNTKPAKKAGQQSGRKAGASQTTDQKYGESEGQISRLGDKGIAGVVTSPPYGEQWQRSGSDNYPDRYDGTHGGGSLRGGYGSEEGQIGALKVEGVLTSPPYENSLRGQQDGIDWEKAKQNGEFGKNHSKGPSCHATYGGTQGQIAASKGETYWQAMAQVYASCFRSIVPGGCIAIVVKDYVKNKKRVRLCDDTLKLLQHVGFVPVERIHAMLVEEYAAKDLFDGDVVTRRERKSFFRRLAEKKGSPRIDWEEVLICRKP